MWKKSPKTVIALFPLLTVDGHTCLSYGYGDDNGPADYGIVLARTRPPRAEDAASVAELKHWLEDRGYVMRVFYRAPGWRQLAAVRKEAMSATTEGVPDATR